MKSLAELQALRDKVKSNMGIREDDTGNTRVVTIAQTGCIGICQYEPVVEVFEPGREKVTYVKMTPEKAARVVAEHLINGKPVAEYTIGAMNQ